MKILLTGMGGPAGICFAKALATDPELELIGADAGEAEIGSQLVSKMHTLPMASSAGYIDALNQLIKLEKIDLLVPLVDEELPVVSKNIDNINCDVLISPYSTIKFTTDKLKAYDKLSAYLPHKYSPQDDIKFPVFVKPRIGRGGKDTHLVKNLAALKSFSPKEYIIQEVLSEPEVTIDCLFGSQGQLLAISPRIRAEVQSAISVSGITFENSLLSKTVHEISNTFKFFGPVNLQFMTLNGKYVLTEINARSSGGMGITVNSGLNIPLMAIHSMLGKIDVVSTRSLGLYANFDEVILRQKLKLIYV